MHVSTSKSKRAILPVCSHLKSSFFCAKIAEERKSSRKSTVFVLIKATEIPTDPRCSNFEKSLSLFKLNAKKFVKSFCIKDVLVQF